ncbi:hypothetical protein [Methanorbis rubei]|uniref:Uncharacterized protein n=1 Tax=Methanorbis rubei TaxID=3028300 RepID=A0AAE4MET5_9EURY|nr:hypothetical protein [Methanocorpusculaceae archaeon Cs1]
MADAPEGMIAHEQQVCAWVIPPKIGEEEATAIVRKWLGSDTTPFISMDKVRFGKAVMVYYPFWRYRREDGGEDKTLYRPAAGTLLTGLQNIRYYEETGLIETPSDAVILPATVDSSVYLPDLHGIARGEELIGIPLWLISYKVKSNVYMIKVDANSGSVYPEWHPIKEPINWKKTALTAFIPMFALSLIAIYLNPWVFIIVVILLFIFLYQSEMLGIITKKEKEEAHGP